MIIEVKFNNKITCRGCRDVLYSFYTTDYKTCSCGECSITGGFKNTTVTGDKAEILPYTIQKDIPLIRERFVWTAIMDEDSVMLRSPIRKVLEGMETLHILNILTFFTEKLLTKDGTVCTVNRQWVAYHLIFIHELRFREQHIMD